MTVAAEPSRTSEAAESCAAFPAAGCPTPRWCEADGRVCARRDIAASECEKPQPRDDVVRIARAIVEDDERFKRGEERIYVLPTFSELALAHALVAMLDA